MLLTRTASQQATQQVARVSSYYMPDENVSSPGPYLPRFCLPWKFEVGEWVYVEGGRFNHPLTRVQISARGRAFGNPWYDIVTEGGNLLQEDCPEQSLRR